MEPQLEAMREVRDFLAGHGVPHLVLGGIANAVWGRPRATQDADFKVIPGERTISEFVSLLGGHFKFRVADPVSFAQRTYVVPILASNGVGVDLGLGFFPYEEQAVERAVLVERQGVSFSVCTAEDLIIHKAISERQKDWDDIEGVLLKQGGRLDQAYIMEWLEQFAQVLERPELITCYRELRKKARDK